MLLVQLVRWAASRTFWTAGSSRPMSTAMIAMTTSNSISVNADRANRGLDMTLPLYKRDETLHALAVTTRPFVWGAGLLRDQDFRAGYEPARESLTKKREVDPQV